MMCAPGMAATATSNFVWSCYKSETRSPTPENSTPLTHIPSHWVALHTPHHMTQRGNAVMGSVRVLGGLA